MTELGDSLERMSFMQLLLLFGFVTCYVLAIGGLFGSTVRWRAAGLAALLAAVFSGLTEPWVHGALLIAFVVAGLGVFVLASWMLARVLGPRALTQPADTAADSTEPASQPQRPGDERPAAPKLARRARAAR